MPRTSYNSERKLTHRRLSPPPMAYLTDKRWCTFSETSPKSERLLDTGHMCHHLGSRTASIRHGSSTPRTLRPYFRSQQLSRRSLAKKSRPRVPSRYQHLLVLLTRAQPGNPAPPRPGTARGRPLTFFGVDSMCRKLSLKNSDVFAQTKHRTLVVKTNFLAGRRTENFY